MKAAVVFPAILLAFAMCSEEQPLVQNLCSFSPVETSVSIGGEGLTSMKFGKSGT